MTPAQLQMAQRHILTDAAAAAAAAADFVSFQAWT
jgi:hypothetical protein